MIRVLIVDDAAFMRMAIKNILVKNGFEVVAEAENGVEALKKYQDTKPDIVTMDITMPEMNGLEALKAIRQYDSKAKVVMVSSMGQDNLVREAVINGSRSFIIKPYKEDHVIKTLIQVASK